MKKSLGIKDECKDSTIKDKRIRKRLEKTAEHLSRYPECTIPQACESYADIKGVYRMFDNEKVTADGILSGHREMTKKRIAKLDIVLLVQDTTSLNYTSHRSVEGIGAVGTNPGSRGILLHSTLALTKEGVPLGIMDQKYWTRPIEERGKKHRRKELKTEEKESYRWIEALERSTEGIAEETIAVTIADREADIYDLFKRSRELKRDILVRAVGSRHVSSEEKVLLKRMEACTSSGRISVTIPRSADEKKGERNATLEVKYCEVEIVKPARRIKEKEMGLSGISLYAIYANEIECEADEEPIQWLLLTSLPITCLAEAIEKIEWYRHRWRIERFHYVLKSGCGVEELQLETVGRLQNAIALYSIIAWWLLWITYENRLHPDASCTVVLEKHEWQTLWGMVHQNTNFPKEAPSLQEAVRMIARLGGFIGRKNDGNPGTKVLWRGLRRLYDVASFWSLINPQRCG